MVIVNVAVALIVTLNWALAVCPAASVTVTLNRLVPVAVGVPLTTPVLPFRVNPAGAAPEVIDHVYGVVPPLATIVLE